MQKIDVVKKIEECYESFCKKHELCLSASEKNLIIMAMIDGSLIAIDAMHKTLEK